MKKTFLIAGLTLALITAAPLQAFADSHDDNASTNLTAAPNAAALTGNGTGSLYSHATETPGDAPESITAVKTVKGKFIDGAIHKVKAKKARYSDAYFTNDSTKAQKNLAKLSMLASATAYGKGKSQKNRSAYSASLLEQCGFVDYAADGKPGYKRVITSADDNDHVSYAIGAKKINDFTVIAVWVKGTGDSFEWVSNFNLGTDKTHKGYALATKRMRKSINLFMKTHRITGNVKWWITGHSRGAAVANLFAKSQTDAYGKENVYAYTFASPRVSRAAKSTGYENVFNYLNPGDYATELPPSKWGYGRFGIDVTFSSETLPAMKENFLKYAGESYDGYDLAERDCFIDVILDYVNGNNVRAFYKKNPKTGVAPATFFREGVGYFMAGDNSGLFTAAKIAAKDPKAAKVLAKLLLDGNGVVSSKINHSHCQLSYLCWLDAM